MALMILFGDGKYQVVHVPEGAIADRMIAEKYPGCIFVDDARTMAEADSKIERDRARRRTESW